LRENAVLDVILSEAKNLSAQNAKKKQIPRRPAEAGLLGMARAWSGSATS
jgi:hypothetical protein